jgi:anti-sigma factor ChrR (cupin superfamily)
MPVQPPSHPPTDYRERACIDASPVLRGASDLQVLETHPVQAGAQTMVVRHPAGSAFRLLADGCDTEVLVLRGSVRDGGTRHEKGTYLRLPAGSGPQLATDDGCCLFVKQCPATERADRVVVATEREAWHPGLVPGLSVMSLHSGMSAHTALVRWQPHTRFHAHRHFGGEEILVLSGVFRDEHGSYPEGTWLRSPHQSQHQPFVGAEGTTILVKVGHLLGVGRAAGSGGD